MTTLVCLAGCCHPLRQRNSARASTVSAERRTAPGTPPLTEKVSATGPSDLPFDGTSSRPAPGRDFSGRRSVSALPGTAAIRCSRCATAILPRKRGSSPGYLLSPAWHGDSGGADDEIRPHHCHLRPPQQLAHQRRTRLAGARVDETAVAIFRLGGIYGPGRNGMVRLLRGNMHRIAKPGHVSNRIHVYDIAQAIDAAFARCAAGVFNVVDDEPASPSDQIAFAADLIGIEPPPEIPIRMRANRCRRWR